MTNFIITLEQAFSGINRGYNFLTGGSLTPLEPVENALDTIPSNVWKNKNYKFLLPCEDYGWILFSVINRLNKGLEKSIPNDEERMENIYSRIIIIPKTHNIKGDIYAKKILMKWLDSFNLKDRIKLLDVNFLSMENNMKFDVIIGNPPYQQNYGNTGGNSANAKSIYNLFMQKAFDMKPNYVVMITPSRYMTKTAQGITDSWVDSVLKCNHFRVYHDYENSGEIFPDVSIAGGISYFLWDRDYNGDCTYYYHKAKTEKPLVRIGKLDDLNTGIVIRDPNSYTIIKKIESVEGKYYNKQDKNFSSLVSSKDFFNNRIYLTSNWKDYSNKKTDEFHIKYYVVEGVKWIADAHLQKNRATKDLWKVYIPAAGNPVGNVLGKPFIGEPNSVCSQSFLIIGYDPQKHHFTENECKNIISYINTCFFRYLVSIKKKTQNGPKGVYQFVPMQDFSKSWTDKELYEKYGLSDEDVEIIEKNIKISA